MLHYDPNACWNAEAATDSAGHILSGGEVDFAVTVTNKDKVKSPLIWFKIELRSFELDLPGMIKGSWSAEGTFVTHRPANPFGPDYGSILIPATALGPGKKYTYRMTVLFQEVSRAEYRFAVATGPAFSRSDLADPEDLSVVTEWDDLWTAMRICY